MEKNIIQDYTQIASAIEPNPNPDKIKSNDEMCPADAPQYNSEDESFPFYENIFLINS